MIRTLQRRLRSLGRDLRGVTIVEFAIVAPVMLLLIMGLGELAYQAYVQSVLTGAMQKAGRDSGLQGGAKNTAAIDQTVMDAVRQIASGATFTATRASYAQFGDIAPEPFTDSNGNGVHDPKECFSDVNGNGSWDADPGVAGQGGANDVTLYTMTVTYPRLFPLSRWIGWGTTKTLQAKTLLKNQPYTLQTEATVQTICPT